MPRDTPVDGTGPATTARPGDPDVTSDTGASATGGFCVTVDPGFLVDPGAIGTAGAVMTNSVPAVPCATTAFPTGEAPGPRVTLAYIDTGLDAQVARLYRAVLGRAPDDQGLGYRTRALQQGALPGGGRRRHPGQPGGAGG